MKFGLFDKTGILGGDYLFPNVSIKYMVFFKGDITMES